MPPSQDKLSTTWKNIEDESDLTDLTSDDDELDEDLEPSPPVQPPRPIRPTAPALSKPVSASNRKSTRPSTREATQKSKARTSDKFPLPCLTRGRISPMTTWTLYELIKQGKIELNPEYQRGVVWTEAKQSSFINTLFHHFHAPQVLFSVTMDENGAILRTCIDGKQRLSSICAFFDGLISLKPYLNAAAAPKGKNRSYWFRKEKSSRNTLLPSHIMDNLKNAIINCVEYDGLSPEHEREMFQRVQFGVPLCPADRFPAINGPWADLVRDLRNRINTTEGFEGYLDWGKARGKDFLALARIVYLAVKGTTRANEPSSARVETFLHSTEGNPSELKSPMVNTMDIFCRIAQNPDLGVPLTVDLSPLEFVMAGYLIYLLRTKLTDEQLSNSISRMRGRAKQACGEDMKFKTENFKCILAFIRDECNKLKKFTRGKQVVAADKPFERVESEMDRFSYNAPLDEDQDEKSEKGTVDDSGIGAQKTGGKRTRTNVDNESEDSDHVYLPAKRVKQKQSTPNQLQTSGNTAGLSPSVSTLKVSVGADHSPARTTIRRVSTSASRSCGAPAPRGQIARTYSQTAKPSVPPSAALRSSPASTFQIPSTPEAQNRNARSVTQALPTPISTPTTDVVSGRRPSPSVDSVSLSHDSHAEGGSGNKYSRLKFSKKMSVDPVEGQSIVAPTAWRQVQQPVVSSPYSPIDSETMQKIGCLTLTTLTTTGSPFRPPMRISVTPTTTLSPPQMFVPNPAGARVENIDKPKDPRLISKSKAVAGGGSSNATDTTNTGTSGAGNRRQNTPHSPIKRSSTDHFSSKGFYLQPSEERSKYDGP